jgi:hypothetical protein
MLSEDFKEFLRLLNEHRVEYLVVGGYAVGLHGYPRYTGDLDIWVRSTMENGERVVEALHQFGLGSLEVKAEDFTRENSVVQLGYPPVRIDLITSLDGVKFHDCYSRRDSREIDGIGVDIIAFDDLKANKRATGRARDLDDLENLT